MENRNLIIILVAIIVVLAAAIGVGLMNQANSKQPTEINVVSDNEQYEDGKLSVKLTDSNNTPISNEVINITITNSKGKVVVDDVVKTNSKGKAKFNLDLKKGKYTVNATFDGNDNFTANSTIQKLTIKEEVKQAQTEGSSSSANSDPGAFYSEQSNRMFYTGDTKEGADGHTWRHLGYNQWEKID